MQAAMALLVVALDERNTSTPWLGIEIARSQPLITSVVPGLAAAKAGVRVGDELVSVSVASAALSVVGESPDRASVVLRVRRGGDLLPIAVSPDDATSADAVWTRLVDSKAPEFTTTTLDDAEVSFRDLSGHVVVLDFWETTCEGCAERLSRLSALQEKYPELRVLGVSSEHVVRVHTFIASNPVRYALLRDDEESISTSYFADAPPMLIVIDKDCIVRKVEVGACDFDALEADVLRLMK